MSVTDCSLEKLFLVTWPSFYNTTYLFNEATKFI
jgi:hypothetical protein